MPFRLLILSVSLLLLSYSCTERRQNEQKHEKLISVSRNGLETNYEQCGEGNLTLVFLHGWGINQTYWSNQVERFCSTNHIITVDLAGFGKSGKNRSEWTVEEYAKDINTLIDELKLKNVVLIGHSMAGDIVLETALNNKNIKAIIGVDNFKEVGQIIGPDLQAEIDGFIEMLKNNYREVVGFYAEGALFHPSTDSLIKRRVISDIQSSDSTVAIESLASYFEYSQMEKDKLKDLEIPLFLINSSATPTDTEALEGTGVTFKLREIIDSGHYPMIEKIEEFNEALESIIKIIEY